MFSLLGLFQFGSDTSCKEKAVTDTQMSIGAVQPVG
jgi:hypothetical protein